jgi:hypothetical protein
MLTGFNIYELFTFIKIKNYAVINLNNMFPVPKGNIHMLIYLKNVIRNINHCY